MVMYMYLSMSAFVWVRHAALTLGQNSHKSSKIPFSVIKWSSVTVKPLKWI